MSALPPVIATLLADTKEYTAKMSEAQGKMEALGASAEGTSSKFATFASKASTAVLGLGVAIGGYALDKAYTFQEGLDKIQNQAGLTNSQIKALGNSILATSSQTGVAASDISSAALLVEQAGVRGTAAMNMLNAASQAAVITNSSVANTTQALVSVEKLHSAAGMDVATTMGVLVAGSKNYVGGMAAETSMLSGRVGVALSEYGLKLKTLIPLGQTFAQVGLPSRSIASFAAGLGKINAPLETTHVTAKKSYTTLSTYALALNNVGLSAAKLQTMLHEGDIAGILKSIRDAAGSSTSKLAQLVNLVFGTGGGATASVLIKNLNALNTATKNLSGSGAGSLKSGFQNALSQLGPQLNILKQKLINLMIVAGEKLLPFVSHAVSALTGTFNYFSTHSFISTGAADIAASAFAASMATKMAGVGVAIATYFGADMAAGAAAVAGTAFGLAVLTALGLYQLGASGHNNADVQKTRGEWAKNKAGGAFDVAAMTANTLMSGVAGLANGLDPLHALPGNNSLFRGNVGAPKIPILGPSQRPPKSAQGKGAPGWGADISPVITVHNKTKAKLTR